MAHLPTHCVGMAGLDLHIHITLMTNNNIVFSDGASDVIRIDSQGFHYREQFIADAGEAHRLLVEFLRKCLPEIDWKHAD